MIISLLGDRQRGLNTDQTQRWFSYLNQ